MSLAKPPWLRGWRLWLAIALVVVALFVFFFSACGRGEGEPAESPAATGR